MTGVMSLSITISVRVYGVRATLVAEIKYSSNNDKNEINAVVLGQYKNCFVCTRVMYSFLPFSKRGTILTLKALSLNISDYKYSLVQVLLLLASLANCVLVFNVS